MIIKGKFEDLLDEMIRLQKENINRVFYVIDLNGILYGAREIVRNDKLLIFKYSTDILINRIAYIPIDKIVSIMENE